jgi:hypothetical protein
MESEVGLTVSGVGVGGPVQDGYERAEGRLNRIDEARAVSRIRIGTISCARPQTPRTSHATRVTQITNEFVTGWTSISIRRLILMTTDPPSLPPSLVFITAALLWAP